MTNADHDANGLRPIPDSRGHSGFRRHIPVFKRQRQKRSREETWNEERGGQDKSDDSRTELSHWMRDGFCLSRGRNSLRWLSTWSELPVSPWVLK
jgi:hypothetical protein